MTSFKVFSINIASKIWLSGQVWSLIVSIPDLCLLLYFIPSNSNSIFEGSYLI